MDSTELILQELQKINGRLDTVDGKLDSMERRLDVLEQQKDVILDEATHRMKVLLDAEVRPQFQLLAEAMDLDRERFAEQDGLERVQDELSMLQAVVRQHTREINQLKKAQ